MRTYPANDKWGKSWQVTIVKLNDDIPKQQIKVVKADNAENAIQRACGDTPEWMPGMTVDTLRNYYLDTANIAVKGVKEIREETRLRVDDLMTVRVLGDEPDTIHFMQDNHKTTICGNRSKLNIFYKDNRKANCEACILKLLEHGKEPLRNGKDNEVGQNKPEEGGS